MVLSYQSLLDLAQGAVPMIRFPGGINLARFQPASIDCPLGDRAYCLRAATIPRKGELVQDLLKKLCRYDFALQPQGSVLERGLCYIIPLNLELALTANFMAVFSPKSSVGRNDVFVRVLSDSGAGYDKTSFGYQGKLYLEVMPLSFAVKVVPGLDLTQMRLRQGLDQLTNHELEMLHAKHGIIRSKTGESLANGRVVIEDDGISFHVDLDREIVGFEARENPAAEVCLDLKDSHDPNQFWIPIPRPENGELILSPGRFYLLTTCERVKIPPEVCAEVVPYDVAAGEFRSHYAGFFDSGFGGQNGTNAVLEVRVRDIPFRLGHGQKICRMLFEPTDQVPEKLYGAEAGSHYIVSGPCLAKHYKNSQTVWK